MRPGRESKGFMTRPERVEELHEKRAAADKPPNSRDHRGKGVNAVPRKSADWFRAPSNNSGGLLVPVWLTLPTLCEGPCSVDRSVETAGTAGLNTLFLDQNLYHNPHQLFHAIPVGFGWNQPPN